MSEEEKSEIFESSEGSTVEFEVVSVAEENPTLEVNEKSTIEKDRLALRDEKIAFLEEKLKNFEAMVSKNTSAGEAPQETPVDVSLAPIPEVQESKKEQPEVITSFYEMQKALNIGAEPKIQDFGQFVKSLNL